MKKKCLSKTLKTKKNRFKFYFNIVDTDMSNQVYRNSTEFYRTWDSERFTGIRNNSQSLTSGVNTVVIFESVGPSLDNISYSGGIFTINKEGLYLIDCLCAYAASAIGTRCAHFRINGDSVQRFMDCKNALSSGTSTNNLNMTWNFASGDTFEVLVNQSSGIPLDLFGIFTNSALFTTIEINLLQTTA